jgi:integrase
MHTFPELCTGYLAEMAVTQSPSTQHQQRLFFARLVAAWGPLPVEQLTPDLLRAWKAAMVAQYQPASVHRYMAILGRVLDCAVAWGWLAANPLRSVRKPSAGRGRVRFLTEEERIRLLTACRGSSNPCLYPVVVVALYTGGRKNEVRCLRWPEVDLERGVVRFVRTKTQVPRTVPVLGQARAVLQGLAARRLPGVAWVFPTANGQMPRDIEYAWTVARATAQLENFHFHDLRHTFASYLAMSGASLRDIAEALGHQKIATTFRYAHVTEGHTRSVIEGMVRHFLPEEES